MQFRDAIASTGSTDALLDPDSGTLVFRASEELDGDFDFDFDLDDDDDEDEDEDADDDDDDEEDDDDDDDPLDLDEVPDEEE